MPRTDRDPPAARQVAALGAGLAVAVAVRVASLASKWRDPLLVNDSLWYSGQAEAIARGDGFADPFVGGPSAEHGPLTPVLLSPVSWVDDPVAWQRAVMTLLGVVTVVFVGLVALRLAGWSAAIAATWIAALSPNLWLPDSLVMSETPAVLLVTIALWLALGLLEPAGVESAGVESAGVESAGVEPARVGAWRPLALGAVLGLATLARSELLLFVPLLGAAVWWGRGSVAGRSPKLPLLVAAGAIATIAPWVGANLVRFEQPVFLSTNDGTTLLGANCDGSYFGTATGAWDLGCVFASGSRPGEDPSERAARQRREAFDYARDHVERMPVVVAARLGRTFDLYGVAHTVAGDVGEERNWEAAWAGVVLWWALAVGAVAGWLQLPRGPRAVLLAPIVVVVLTTVAFYGGHRMRAPAEPVVVSCAAVFLASLVDRRRLLAGGSRVAPVRAP